MKSYEYNDANPDYRIIARTYYLTISKVWKKVISLMEYEPLLSITRNSIKLVAKCVFYSHPKLEGVLRAKDKRIYLN